jgi:hypothetical protein
LKEKILPQIKNNMFGLFNRSKNTVKNPKILLASIGASDETFFAADREIYKSYFSDITEHKAATVSDFFDFIGGKTFDIVHLFAEIKTNGTIEDVSGQEILENLSQAQTKVVLFASGNSGDSYIAFYPKRGAENINPMNAVMTLDRKGDLFPKFFKSIFGFMVSGDTMPQAWVKLAPQNSNIEHDAPETIFSAGFGAIKFSR